MNEVYNSSEYIKDRVERVMESITKIDSNSHLTSDQRTEEIRQTLIWHIARTLFDQKSQLKFVMSRKVPEMAITAKLVIDQFNMHLSAHKRMTKEMDKE